MNDTKQTKKQLIEELAEACTREEALRESEELYRSIVETIDIGLNLIDCDHNIVMVNAAQGRHFNKSPHEMAGKKCFREFERRDVVCPHCPGIQAIATGRLAEVEIYRVRDGIGRFMRLRAFPTFGQDGTVSGFIEIAQDITERKMAADALRESEERYRAFADATSEGVLLHKDGVIIDVNQSFLDMYGYDDPSELIGKNSIELTIPTPEDREKIYQSIKSGGTGPYEVMAKRANDGTTFPIEINARQTTYKGEKVRVALIRDTTYRKRAEEALERRALQLQTAAEVSHAASSVLDPEELIQQVVNLVRERFGLYYAGLFLVDQTGEGTGEPGKWAVLRAGTGEAGRRMVAQGHKLEIGGESMIGWCVTHKQARIALDIGQEEARFANPLLPDTHSEVALPLIARGQVIGAMTVQGDQPAAFSDADLGVLQTMADQLANAISNARLYEQAQKAKEAAEEANRLKSQFLANMSHELRTPLNAIINFAYLLSIGTEGPLTAEQEDLLNRIGDSGRHLLGLINDILDLAKIEAGQMDLFFEEVDLGEQIDGVLSTAVGLVRDKPIELRKELPDELPLVHADRTRARQVLLNLLSNAAKFTEEGHITVRAWADDDWVTVSVQDTGVGMAAEDIPEAFAEFVQLEEHLKRRAGGTGLGLSISKYFVERHGGHMWVESEVSVGSTFYFTLPCARVILPIEAADALTEVHVLVIDDDATTCEAVARQLAPGYEVSKLGDSRQVLAAVRRNRPDVVVLDILMPYRDGWEVLQTLKAEPDTRDIPIIMCSVLREQKMALSLGADAFLVKPLECEELRRVIAQFTPQGGKVLAVDDDPNALEIIRRFLDGTAYRVVTAQDGMSSLAMVREQMPDVVVLDLMMPGMSGFEVLAELRTDPRTAALPVVIVTAKDLTLEERAQLQAQAAALMHKGQFSAEEFMKTIRRAAARGAGGGDHG